MSLVLENIHIEGLDSMHFSPNHMGSIYIYTPGGKLASWFRYFDSSLVCIAKATGQVTHQQG